MPSTLAADNAPPSFDKRAIKTMADALRVLSADAVERANSGHPGLPLGMADVAATLFRYFLRYDPSSPEWPNRDRFVLSAGHGSMLLYAALHFAGYEGMTMEHIKNFRKIGSPAAGHPEYGEAPGIETTTGPLGQGLANAVGFALAERMANARLGDDVICHKTYVLAGDGCLMEGISQEAISLAGHLRLKNLIVLFDDNGITIDGKTSLSTSEDAAMRFRACGWEALKADGHDVASIYAALEKAQTHDKPTLIAFKTIIGYGTKHKAGTEKCHGSPLGDEEIAHLRETLGRKGAAFAFEKEVYDCWRARAHPNAAGEWKKRYDALPEDERRRADAFLCRKGLPEAAMRALDAFKHSLAHERPALATRQASEKLLNALSPVAPQLIGGSADLTGSNLTKTADMTPVSATDFKGRYVYYGIREHAMAAAMNGMALYGGFIPYGGTFLAFSDYCRPSIRLSALMKLRVIYVMTHDSIGLGEDGPTHQPIEHLAALRAIPNLFVFRPADAMETAECWELALQSEEAPSLLALSRQKLPYLREAKTQENMSARGAYVAYASGAHPDVVIAASGSEVSIAIEAAKKMEERCAVRVLSVPCTELFEKQGQEYIDSLLPEGARHAVVEAGVSIPWRRFVRKDADFFCIETFGASGPFEDVYAHFGVTAEKISKSLLKSLGF
ncbi:MAG: transketolase [Rickettsiales bacterium]